VGPRGPQDSVEVMKSGQ